MVQEDASKIRTIEKYNEKLDIVAKSTKVDFNETKGVKYYCQLSDLSYFHIISNPTIDIMHDVYEGAIPLILSLFFRKLIELKLSSLDELSKIVQLFNYGFLDRRNIPSPLDLDKRSLGQNATQSVCLFRNIPFIFHRYRDHPDLIEIWKGISALQRIVVFLFSTELTDADLEELEKQTTLFIVQIIKCGCKVSPKPHFMLHYPRIIRTVGPLVHMNMLKYERKHQELKSFQNRNFKNLNKMLAEKHQQKICINEFSCADNIEEGHKKRVENDLKYENILSTFETDDISELKYLIVNNYNYRKDLLVIHDSKFCRIEKVLVIENRRYLLCFPCKINSFNEFLNSFQIEVETSHDYFVVALDELKKPKTYEIQCIESVKYIKNMPDMCLNLK